MENLQNVSKETAWQFGYIKGVSDTIYYNHWMQDNSGVCCSEDSSYKLKKPKITTNSEKVRRMSDEELADLLLDGCCGSRCDDQQPTESGWIDCLQCRLNWLRQPAKEDNNE